MWARGIIPFSMSRGLLPEDFEESKFREVLSTPAEQHSRVRGFTDGAGGNDRAPGFATKCGAGAACFGVNYDTDKPKVVTQLTNVKLIFSDVPGRQSVPRAETAGLLGLLAAIDPKEELETCTTDAQYVVNGCKNTCTQHGTSSKRLWENGANGDLWSRVKEEFGNHTFPMPDKVKSHLLFSDLYDPLDDSAFLKSFGNELADMCASVSGKRQQHSMWPRHVPATARNGGRGFPKEMQAPSPLSVLPLSE